jgi:hypothetical protein
VVDALSEAGEMQKARHSKRARVMLREDLKEMCDRRSGIERLIPRCFYGIKQNLQHRL